MATLYSLSEQVLSMIEGGDSPAKKKFERSEVKRLIVQSINTALKVQHISDEMAAGESIPDGTVLAEYDNVAVETYKNVSRATLPIMPIKLPMNMGIFHVSKTDNIIDGFIPFEPGQLQMIKEEAIISDLLGQIGYEPRGKYIVFGSDITTGDADTKIESVYMLLAVKDLSLYGDWDLLPITADMEKVIIETVYKFLTGQTAPNKKVDVISKEQEVQP